MFERHKDAAPLALLYSIVGCGLPLHSRPASYGHGICLRSYRAFEHVDYLASWSWTRRIVSGS